MRCRICCRRSSRSCARPASAPRDAALRRPAHGRHGAARRQRRRDEDRRRQDAGRDAARCSERPRRASGVHVVTVNDYLAQARRGVDGPLYEFLGLTVGVIQHGLIDQRREALHLRRHLRTNNEVGFDYLRDNMAFSIDDSSSANSTSPSSTKSTRSSSTRRARR